MEIFTIDLNFKHHNIASIADTSYTGGFYQCIDCSKRCFCSGYHAPESIVKFRMEFCGEL